MEARATDILTKLITPKTIRSHVHPNATLGAADAFQLASKSKCGSVSSIIHEFISNDIWSGRIDAYDALCMVESLGDDILISAACYMLMRQHEDVREVPDQPRLSPLQREAIERGSSHYYREWDRSTVSFARLTSRAKGGPVIGGHWQSHQSCLDQQFLALTWKAFTTANIPAYDVLRRFTVAKAYPVQSVKCGYGHGNCKPCREDIREWFGKKIENLTSANVLKFRMGAVVIS